MSEVAELMLLTSIISGITAVGIIVVVVLLLKSRSLLHHFGNATEELRDSVRTHKNVVAKLPEHISQDVAKEIRSGVEPIRRGLQDLSKEVTTSTGQLVRGLSESHDTLVKTLMTINSDGSLTEWVESLRETIEPLQITTGALEQHYQTAEKLLDKTGELVFQWTSQKQVVENAFTKFSSLIEEWALKETIHSRDIESRIMERLKEVTSINDRIAQGFSELQSSQIKMSDSQQALSESVKRVVEKVWEITDADRLNQERHQSLVRNQEMLQDQLRTLQSETERRSNHFESQVAGMLKKLSVAQDNFITEAKSNYIIMHTALNEFHQQHERRLGAINNQHENMIKRQAGAFDQQDKILAHFEGIIDTVPTKMEIKTIIFLSSVNVIIMGAIAYGILFK